MFKFARYFFIGFFITTVIPLFMMFFWTHHQMEKMVLKDGQHIINLKNKELEETINQYLKVEEAIILEKLQKKYSPMLSLSEIATDLDADKVEAVYNNKNTNLTSYYAVINNPSFDKPELYSVFVFPVKNSKIKGLKISNKVDLNQFKPRGPFDLVVYYGNKIEKSTYKEIITRRPPPPNENFHHSHEGMPPRGFQHREPTPEEFHPIEMPPPMPPYNMKNNVDIENIATRLTDSQGKTIVLLTVFPAMPPRPFGHVIPPINNLFGLIVLLAGAVLSLVTGVYINNNFVKPQIEISEALKKVKDGDLSSELSTKGIKQKNILDTYHNFNKMIKGLNEKENLRKNFISNLTHDLRTPLIAQEKSLELLSNKFEALNLKDELELSKSLEKNSHHLLRMVNLILDSYGFDKENLNISIKKVKVFDAVESCYETLKPLFIEKNARFINEIPKDFPEVNADLTSLKRIFLNLISNALENTKKEGLIKISAQKTENNVKFFVEDNGNGISEQDLSLVFDRYYSGKSFERKLGSGLGLDVCKKLIELHNGEIEVESKLNEYTKFTITLPLNQKEGGNNEH